MAFNLKRFETEAEWLEARKNYIGGSECASIIGLNPWKSNVELWREKTGRKAPDDLHGNAAVEFGKAAEEHLRELFALDYKERGIRVDYAPFNFWTNTEYPWAHASLDGWLMEYATGKKGIFEAKTATINSTAQAEKWRNGIPQNYLCQLLHYFAVTGADFAILTAYLRYSFEGEEIDAIVRRYRLEREQVKEQIDYLMKKEREFWEHVKNDTEPPLFLNI